MLFVLLTALLLVALLAAKPTEASFSAFWRTRTLTNRLLATFAMDTFEKQWIDLVFIVLVRCVKRRAVDGGDRRRGEGVEAEKWFIGVAGKWFRIPDDYSTLLGSYFAPSAALSENASQARLGDEKEGEADRAKGAGNFARAARLYRERAEMEDESLPFMRGLYYEKAATAGAKSDDGGSVAAWSMAAESFVKAGRMGRAAQCHLAIAQLCRSDEAAFARHKLKAADLFSADNDSRAADVHEEVGDFFAERLRWSDAAFHYRRVQLLRSANPVLARRHLFFALICEHLGGKRISTGSGDESAGLLLPSSLDEDQVALLEELKRSGTIDVGQVPLAPRWMHRTFSPTRQ